MGATSAEIFQALGNVHAAKELLNMLARKESVAGRLYLRILAFTLSILNKVSSKLEIYRKLCVSRVCHFKGYDNEQFCLIFFLSEQCDS